MGFASFTVLIWDHIITFDREVEHIWPAKKNLRACLPVLVIQTAVDACCDSDILVLPCKYGFVAVIFCLKRLC